MRGWLIVNAFLRTGKFEELYAFLQRAAKARGTELLLVPSDRLMIPVGEAFDLPDFALFWDKDAFLARRLEAQGLPLFNSAAAVENCDDKMRTALLLHGVVRTPRTLLAPKTFEGVGYLRLDFVRRAVELLGLPLVIKEAFGSFGAQVHLARMAEEAERIVASFGARPCLFQQFLSSSIGKDVRVNVVGGRVVSAMLRENANDFRSNITNGGTMSAYEPDAAWRHAAIAAARAVGADFAGVDILFGEHGEPVVCEVNSNPHFKSTLACTGKDLSEEIMRYVTEKLG